VRERLEYAALWILFEDDWRDASAAREICRSTHGRISALGAAWIAPRRNGEFASGISRWSKKQRRTALRGMVRQLGWMGAELPTFRASRKRISSASSCSMDSKISRARKHAAKEFFS